jgi:hypothetical protein
LPVSLTAKATPVAVSEIPGVGDQSTVTLVGSPPSSEIMMDFDNPMLQSILAGDTLKAGRDTALFYPPMVKSEESEVEDCFRVGGLGQPATVTVIEVSSFTKGEPPTA